MAEDQVGARKDNLRDFFLWTRIFHTFKVALDPKKLVLAAAGILVMAAGWWILAIVFYGPRQEPKAEDYPVSDYKAENVSDEQARRQAGNEFQVALNRYRLLRDTAGPGGRLRTWPWFEDRGPNPFMQLESWIGGRDAADTALDAPAQAKPVQARQFLVLIEPLVKFLEPVVYVFHPYGGGWNRVYFLLVVLWTLVTWALFGAAIARMAAVQFARNEKIGMTEAVRFAWAKYVSFLSAPLFPLIFIAALTVFLVIFGIFAGFTWFVGDILIAGLFWPLVILFGLIMAVVLVGLVGWPLMYATISAEGSDSFDALSRSYSYVYQAIWHYLWYAAVAVVYGAVVVFFVGLMGSLMVYLGKWAVSQAPLPKDRHPAYLFVYAPQSYHWRDLLLEGTAAVNTPAEARAAAQAIEDDLRKEETKVDKELGKGTITADKAQEKKLELRRRADQRKEAAAAGAIKSSYLESLSWNNRIGAGLVAFWLFLIFLLMIGFGYSFFWSASAIIYLLMRHKVDDTDLDEVHLEEEDMEEPFMPPTGAPAGVPAAKPAGGPDLIPSESLTMRPAASGTPTQHPKGPAHETPPGTSGGTTDFGSPPHTEIAPPQPPPEGSRPNGPSPEPGGPA
jgi:hypothetical protein